MTKEMIDEKPFRAACAAYAEVVGLYGLNNGAMEKALQAYEAAKLVGLPDEDFEAWPDNVVAERHEVSGKWVLWYLTDEQAALCQRALPPLAEKQCGICGDYHEGEVPRACETGDGE